ncbi:carboxyl-terminal proteinase, putative [Actinidia rufa]|uniref:Carboxyl-terminal proteinase, putative n=1 Tax=Actinidia rufa TaxID=165716 RepID=A0A7J0EY80_9ERIC|nr:carboxyl-terminal proteinase, putative [Actinidia rufa]
MDLVGGVLELTKSQNNGSYFDHRRRHHQCTKSQTVTVEETRQSNSPNTALTNRNISPIIPVFVCFLFLTSSVSQVHSSQSHKYGRVNQTFRQRHELGNLKSIRAHLKKINKPYLKTIQSPDGDLIDCVLSHQQPAFDHPKLKGKKPMDPPERPKGHNPNGMISEDFQLWSLSGESCPEGTIPIRRTSEHDMLRASSIRRFGRKIRPIRRDSSGSSHEHAVGYVTGQEYYGAKASINVWAPRVANQYEFSLSQMWVISGSFADDLNTIEAGFVQTNNRIAIGAAISPMSSYRGGQFDISLLIWKDPKHGNWWLEFGSGVLVGYWPSFLFSHLRNHASMIQFGGEIVNTRPYNSHTTTQMGSGHFSGGGFGKASYFRNLQVVDWDNSLIPLSNFHVLADHRNCYDIRGGINRVWGNYFYYGGPGRNRRCL